MRSVTSTTILFGNDTPIHAIRLTLIHSIKFSDPKEHRYEVPVPKLHIDQESSVDKPLYKVNVDKTGKLEVVRAETWVAVFKTDLRQLVFSDQFLQLTSDLPSDAVYGLGN